MGSATINREKKQEEKELDQHQQQITTTNMVTSRSIKLSNPQLNHNSTPPQPNITVVRIDLKMTLQTTTTQPQKLNVSNMSAVIDPILMKL